MEVAEKYKGKKCSSFEYCEKCPLKYVGCFDTFKDSGVNFEDLEFADDAPEEIKEYVKKVLNK